MRIDSLGNLNIKPELLEALKNLEVGDIIKGRIMDFLDNTVKIKSTSGHTITASLMTDVPISKGDFVQLMVSSIDLDKIFVQLNMGDKTQSAPKINLTEILNKMDVPINDTNLEAAKLLLKYNMPVNKDSLMSLVNAQKSIGSLAQSSPEGKLGLILSGLNIKNTDVTILSKAALINEAEVKILVDKLTDNTSEKAFNSVSTTVKTLDDKLTETISEKAVIIKPEANQQSSSSSSIAANPKTSAEQVKTEINQILNKLQIPLNSDSVKFISDIAKSLAVVNNSTMEEAAYLLSKDIEVTPNNLEVIRTNINNEVKLDDFLSKLQKQIDTQDNQQLRELKDEIKRVFMHPKQIENKEEVKEKLKDIIKLGDKIDKAINNQNINETEVKSTLVNLRENIDFIRQINQHNNYLQLPLIVNGEQSTADMYVFKDKKRGKNIDPNNATILLALDLKSLGHLESLISVSQKTVNITFRIENMHISEILKNHSPALGSALEAKGYRLNPIKYIKLEQSFNLLMLEDLITDESSEKFHFDKRI